MAPKKASALPGLKIPFSPICTVTRGRADSESSEASGVEARVSVRQSNLPPPQLKEATKKRDRRSETEEPESGALITTAKMNDGCVSKW